MFFITVLNRAGRMMLVAGWLTACQQESAPAPAPVAAPTTDASLFAEAAPAGYTYYVGTPGITPALGNSAHSFERVRFNAVARGALDQSGKLPVGAAFPAGAVIVKELYASATGPLVQYAVMKKDPASTTAGAGYQWAEYALDGRPIISLADKGAACVSCHSGGINRDLARTFDLH